MHRNILFLITVLVTSQTTTFASEPGSLDYARNVIGFNKSVESERSFGVLSSYELDKFQKSLSRVENSKCKHDLSELLHGIIKGVPWAIAMWDASVKVPVGVEYGTIYQFGQFDECMEYSRIKSQQQTVKAQYCLANVEVEGMVVRRMATRKERKTNSTTVFWGVCMPASCSTEDIEVFMRANLGYNVTIEEKMCQTHKEFQPTRGMLLYGAVIGGVIALVLLSTTYHVFQITTRRDKEEKETTLDIALKSFSLIENILKMLQSSKDKIGLDAINGVKALAMFLILAGHALCFVFGGPVANSEFMDHSLKTFENAFLTNSLLFVDIFLFLSGFLFCRIYLMELEKRKGNLNVLFLYLGRYIRLTPAYLTVIMFYVTWFPYVGSGPLWRQRVETEQERCAESWWLNILYINNYFNTDYLCMFQSWYLAVDTQFFIIGGLLIKILSKHRKVGLSILIIIGIYTAIVPFAITYFNNLDPTLMVYPDEVTDLASNEYYTSSYIKTHMRTTVYFFGLATGFIVHLMQEKKVRIPSKFVVLGWILAFIVGITSMYSIALFYQDPTYSALESSLYSAGHKIGWSVAIAWMVIAVTTGHAPVLHRILSSRLFAPLSRLTYCGYLTNGIVELYHAGSIRNPQYMSNITMLDSSASHINDTVLLALFMCLLFESPIHALERIIFRVEKQRLKKEVPNSVSSRDSDSSGNTSEENIP